MNEAILQLLCRMEREPSLQKLVDLSFSLLENPIFYQDIEQSIPYYTQCVTLDDPVWARVVNGEMLDADSISQHLGQIELTGKATVGRKPILLPPHPNHPNGTENMAIPMTSGNQSYGILILTSRCRPFREEDKALFQLFGEMFYAKLMHNVWFGVGRGYSTEQVLIRLLNNESVSRDQLNARLKAMSWQPLPWKYVVSIRAGVDARLLSPLDNILALLTQSPHNRLLRFQNSLVYFYTSHSDNEDFCAKNEQLCALLQKHGLRLGISQPFMDLMELRQYWEQAQQAAHVGALLYPTETVFPYGRMAFFCALDAMPQARRLSMISPRVLQLWKKDRSDGSALLQTLRCYLQCSMDAATCGRKLYIHKNTVRYRIQQCESLLGYSIAEGENSFSLQMSLRTLFFLQQMGQLPPEI